MHKHRCSTLFLLAAACAGASGCIIAVSNRATRSGTVVPQSIRDQIVPGETTKDWVIETLGTPTSAYERSDGTEVLKYKSSRMVKARVAILLLLAVSDTEEEECVVTFEIRDGIVQQFEWQKFDARDPDTILDEGSVTADD